MDIDQLEAEVIALRSATDENTKVLNRMRQTIHGDDGILADGLIARMLALSQKVDQSRGETYSMIQDLTIKIDSVVDGKNREVELKNAIEKERNKWIKIGIAILGSGQAIAIIQGLVTVINAATP